MKRQEATLESVKIYHQGARVFRRVVLSNDKGAAHLPLEVGPLPLALMDASVRVRVVDDSGKAPGLESALVRQVEVGLAPRAPLSPMEGPSDEALRKVARELSEKRELKEHIEHELEALRGLSVPERPEGEEGKPPPASPIAARLALEEFRDEAITTRLSEIDELSDEIDVLDEKSRSLSAKRNAQSTALHIAPGELCKVVVADVQGVASQKSITIEVSYLVPGARWAPAYECRVARDGKIASLQMRALITQHSGEDWTGVKLELSTASPLRYSKLPELPALRIGRAQPPPATRGYRPPPKGAASLFNDFDFQYRKSVNAIPQQSHLAFPSLNVRSLKAPEMLPEPTSEFGVGGSYRREDALSEGMDDTDDGYAEEAAMSADMEMLEEPMMMSAAPPPMPRAAGAPAPAKAMARSSRMSAKKSAKRRAPAVSEEVVSMIAFQELRLSGAHEKRQRNRLQIPSAHERYQESLERYGSRCSDAEQRLRQAERLALEVAAFPSGAVNVKEQAGYFDFTYHAEGRIDVPSDGVVHSVPLRFMKAPVKMRYVVVPREDTHVFRMAKVTNPTSGPLLPGPADIYVGDEFVLSTPLPLVPKGGEFSLGLGVEQAVRCSRNTSFDEKRSGEKVVAMTELEHHIQITVVNNLQRDIECEVHERVPVPQKDAEVVVEESQLEPPWIKTDVHKRGVFVPGGRRWDIEVAGGQSIELRASYTVKIYANNELVGGNRREA